MAREEESMRTAEQAIGPTPARPNLTAWIWRPWYARAWWAVAALFWLGRLFTLASPTLAGIYENAFAAYLTVAFFPPTILMILGIGYAGAWMDHYRGEWVSDPDEGLTRRDAIGSLRDPYTDPADPRSGTLWMGSPRKITERFGRNHH